MPSAVRDLRSEDIPQLERIENEADQMLVDLLLPGSWEPAMSGLDRAAQAGFILVAGARSEIGTATDADAASGPPPVGFVQVLEVDGEAHLEQLAVSPTHGRRGHGRALVDAAAEEARRRNYRRLTLRTYARVPWNAPFYRRCGFRESEPDTPFLLQLVEIEQRLGLDRWGPRVQMTADLT